MLKRIALWATVAVLVLFSGASWYIGYANRTHPAPWAMAGGDAGSRNFAPTPFPAKPAVVWSFPLEPGRYGYPVVGEDNTIYLPGETGLTAIGPDGKKRWTFRSDGPLISAALGRQGTVYAQAENMLHALNPQGQLIWQYPIQRGCCHSMLIGQGGVIYAVARDYVYALSDDGKLKWRFKLNRQLEANLAETREGNLLMVIGEQLYAVKPNGDVAWDRNVGRGATYQALMVGFDGQIYFRGPKLKVLDGDGTWMVDLTEESRVVVNLAAGKGFVQDGVTRRSEAGEVLWTLKLDSPQTYGQTLVDDRGQVLVTTFVFTRPNDLLVPPSVLSLYDKAGNRLWTFDMIRPMGFSTATGDGRICLPATQQGSREVELICIGSE